MFDSSLMTHRSTSFTWEERFGPSRAFKDETAPKRDNDARLRTFLQAKVPKTRDQLFSTLGNAMKVPAIPPIPWSAAQYAR